MKNLYLIILVSCLSLHLKAQSQFYTLPVKVLDTYLRDSAHVIGQLDLNFPVDGKVFVQFDGEGFGDTLDRIILAANDKPDWDTNDGNVSFVSNVKGEGNCFSHTRTFSVSAGQHSFYAVAHNYVDTGGSGIATIFGTLSVEFIPENAGVTGETSTTTEEYEAVLPVAFDTIVIEAPGPGKAELRLNGNLDVNYGDIILVAITETTAWDFTDPGSIALESTNPGENYVGFSTTKVVDIPSAGTYTFYAMAQRGYEEEGNGYMYAYTNFHARFYPDAADHVISGRAIISDNFNLGEDLRLLDSIELDVPISGTVEIRFDGDLQSSPGHQIILAASNSPSYELQNGSVIIETTDEENDRHNFVHTQVFEVEPGTHTYYVMAEDYLGDGTTIDLHGHFLLKFYPENVISANDDVFAELPFEVWPNPANDRIHIQFENANEQMIVSILDVQGHVVRQQGSMVSGGDIDISVLPSGIYIVRSSNGEEVGYKKLVKE
ncbi:MAG TPA: T9SS type A sorting domain-containing protein [Saprospiraceae bacterium]|nr:T9SS type A sorting domain-containing protein [Saprospiraceae bacterium]